MAELTPDEIEALKKAAEDEAHAERIAEETRRSLDRYNETRDIG